ncbi:4a-hydroxytetrahydrobiopterin dehydratase [Ectothiorhodospira lacustris]|uniref:4a-hydroxytetrahydrobiopterin dehydratase n=1 Tax=Ectothiorhodospira lacustris TaxID=2899127 RepID=UPI001EE82455|nr:4a-hydroxytetrahydrobiopterin dehydratase [Ectothiorhodospira lacustris]MCG5502021.1 4a-hydroxytetrahydrobiopterin dehydratase [Ectothiorhodospira lacustris]MCG5509588.1 4a-hydroxytetrahydrobiopterin dehydratase [Ectothiorhodospira lacustris]MCG5521617.1 4a-hydroxytetrahydrobiopterin dehydratase [Ectothiorhodospira lacustris]
MHPDWTRRERPLRLERRLAFPDYEATRCFLEQAGALSEQMGVYPDISFGRTYVNITLHADDNATELSDEQRRFVDALDTFQPTDTAEVHP